MEPQRNSISSLITFWLEYLRNPRSIGSIYPSSESLSRSVANEVFSKQPGQIIELGAGTGAITKTLIGQSEYKGRITVFEKSQNLAEILKCKFSGISIRCCCATEISESDIEKDSSVTIVSSLPFRSLKNDETKKIISTLLSIHQLSNDFRLIQYSYFWTPPFAPPQGLNWRKGEIIFSNIPPARVWILES